MLTPLELMTVLIIYGIDNKMRVYMPLVYMRGYQNLSLVDVEPGFITKIFIQDKLYK